MSALQNIRKGLSSTGSSIIVAILIFGLVATFGGFLSDPSAPSSSPLKVNGKNISFGEFNLEFSRISSLFSENEISEELVSEITKNSIISKELLYQKASEMRFNISDDFVNGLIANDVSFQNDNVFDTALFSGYMARLGLTVNDYRELVKSKFIANNFSDFIIKTEFALDSSALNFIRATNQQRSLSFFKLDLNKISKEEIIPESDILNYYQENQFRFIEPKKISLQYILLDENSFEDSFQVSEEEIQQERNLLQAESTNSQTRVSHIQLSYSSEEDKKKKLNEANNILIELSKSNSFESFVKEYSDDFGSKDIGGDLGYTDGTIFPAEFEIAIDRLTVNQISEVIEMPGSFHILKITEKNDLKLTDDDIKDLILTNKSQEKLDQILINIEENFIGSKLETLSLDLNLSTKSTDLFKKNNIPEELLSFNIEEEMFDQNITSLEFFGPYQNDRGEIILFEVDNIEEEKLLTQAQAEEEITRILQLEQAQETILNKLAKYETQANENNLAEFNSYSLIKRDSSLLPDNLLNDLFSVDLNDPVFVSPQQNGDFYVARLTKIKNSKDLAKKEDIDAAKASLNSINARSYLDSIFEELEADSYIN